MHEIELSTIYNENQTRTNQDVIMLLEQEKSKTHTTIVKAYHIFVHIFLCGSWWGIAREKNKSLITSIIFFFFPLILAFVLCLLEYVFEPSYGKSFKFILGPLVALMLAFEFGHIYEKKMLDLDDDYIELRFKLTFSVRICHLLMIGFIFTNQ